MNQDESKKVVARAAVRYVEAGSVLGVGTGSTVDFFVDALAESGIRIEAAVSSSERTSRKLAACGVRLLDLNEIESIGVYVDGADEIDPRHSMNKGGGGALTREKIVAAVAQRFVCIADASKRVDVLGRFPLPVEVIPMARRHVARQLEMLGGTPKWREGVLTDNGNVILDVHGLRIYDPVALEARIDRIIGVVTNGLFAARGADVLLLGGVTGVQEFQRA